MKSVAFLLAWLTSSTAMAGSFDELGGFILSEGEGYSVAFTAEDTSAIHVFDFEGTPSSEASSLIHNTATPFEGETSLKIGGQQDTRASISLEGAREAMTGKRVYFSLWYQAHGSDLSASIQWVSGNRADYPEQGSAAGTAIGELKFLPTGRITSDGWVEMATAETDFDLGSTIPASFLELVDGHYAQGGGPKDPFIPRHLDDSHVLVDAFEIHEAGPALVPDASCTAPTEQTACGDHGTCLFGKCVDAVSVWGSPPLHSQREGWIKRYVSLFYTSLGSRALQQRGDLLTDKLMAASSATARDFWYAYYEALDDVGAGQSTPVRPTRPWKTTGGGGACLGPGVGDLLPDDDGSPTMMVFKLHEDVDNLVTQTLQPGDILTHVDGLPWREWLDHVPLYAFHVGEDPERLLDGYYLMNAAMTTGATLTFARCSRQDGLPCAEGEVVTVDIDLAQLHAPQLWSDEALEDAEIGYWCDWRFAPRADYPNARGLDDFLFATTDTDGIRHAIFNSFPSTSYGYPERGWEPNYLEAIAEAPSKGFILDMREGWGGDFFIFSRVFLKFLEAGNYWFKFYSWAGHVLDETITQANFDLCFYGSQLCGGHINQLALAQVAPLFDMEPSYPDKPVAILSGRNADTSELMLWLMKEKRTAPTRIFGYAPSFGDFGLACGLPHTLGELTPPLNQCADAVFLDEDGSRSAYLSGHRVAPDELIFQRQSDAIAGIDTVTARAEAWLEEQAALQGGQP